MFHDYVSRQDRIRRFGRREPRALRVTLFTLSALVAVGVLWFVLAQFGL